MAAGTLMNDGQDKPRDPAPPPAASGASGASDASDASGAVVPRPIVQVGDASPVGAGQGTAGDPSPSPCPSPAPPTLLEAGGADAARAYVGPTSLPAKRRRDTLELEASIDVAPQADPRRAQTVRSLGDAEEIMASLRREPAAPGVQAALREGVAMEVPTLGAQRGVQPGPAAPAGPWAPGGPARPVPARPAARSHVGAIVAGLAIAAVLAAGGLAFVFLIRRPAAAPPPARHVPAAPATIAAPPADPAAPADPAPPAPVDPAPAPSAAPEEPPSASSPAPALRPSPRAPAPRPEPKAEEAEAPAPAPSAAPKKPSERFF